MIIFNEDQGFNILHLLFIVDQYTYYTKQDIV